MNAMNVMIPFMSYLSFYESPNDQGNDYDGNPLKYCIGQIDTTPTGSISRKDQGNNDKQNEDACRNLLNHFLALLLFPLLKQSGTESGTGFVIRKHPG